MQDKTPFDENKEPHGLWLIYRSDSSLWYKISYINGQHFGQHQCYTKSGTIDSNEYYAK
jgi:antitoxin component YwqK of YwqJK toxin-antitoxin module